MAKWKDFSVIKEQEVFDPVERPAHYNQGGIECIDYIRQVLGLEGFIAYCKGNVTKYNHRAQWYMNRMVEAMKEKHK